MQLRRVQLAETDSEGKADFLIGIGLTRSQSRNTPRTYRFRSSFALEHPEYPLYDLRKTHSVFKPEDDKQVPIAKIKVTLQKGSARKIRVLNQAGDPWQSLRLIAHCAAPRLCRQGQLQLRLAAPRDEMRRVSQSCRSAMSDVRCASSRCLRSTNSQRSARIAARRRSLRSCGSQMAHCTARSSSTLAGSHNWRSMCVVAMVAGFDRHWST
jgi:hypothetical protein